MKQRVVEVMRRNLRTVVLVPCILACILAVLIFLDKKEISLFPVKGKGSKKTVVSVTPAPSAQPTQISVSTDEPTPEPSPTDTPSQKPAVPASPTPAPKPAAVTPKPTPTSAPSPAAPKATESPKPSGTPENDERNSVTYKAVYKLDGNNYSLIADGNTLTYLILNKQDNSIRKTGYPFDSIYAEFPGEQLGPIIGNKNDRFVFMSNEKIVASDGTHEEVLFTVGDATNINSIVKSDNRILAAIGGRIMCIVDFRNFTVETYNEAFTPDYFALTDEFFSFSIKRRIPAGPYYEYLYTGKNGKVKLLAMIGEINKYEVDTENSIVTITTGEKDVFQLDLKTDKLSTSKAISKERTLYFPAYADGIIGDLSDIRYINRNSSDEQVVLKVLPTSYKAEIYYNSYYDTFYFTFYMPEKVNLLPVNGVAGSFTVIDYSVITLNENKFLRDSTVKELLFSGQTGIGNAEIYLLEKYETYNNESVPFEMVYAWVPIKNSTQAYQLYLYVPRGEKHEPYLNLVKQLIS